MTWLFLFLLMQEPAKPSEPSELLSLAGTYRVSYQTTPAPLPLNEAFQLVVTVQMVSGEPLPEGLTLSVDARMPQHRHGMIQQPNLKQVGPGKYEVEGMLFHMPGRWELYFDMTRGGRTERALAVVELE